MANHTTPAWPSVRVLLSTGLGLLVVLLVLVVVLLTRKPAPQLLVAAPRSVPAQVTLLWDYTQGAVPATKFTMKRQPACTGDFAKLADVTPVGAEPATYKYVDASVIAGQSYCWHVTASSADGKESLPSNSASFFVPGLVSNPINLRITLE
jgi:hypothetical protein